MTSGEVVLLPGLVNAHCHLDYTDMAGELPPPRTFTDWIPLITAAKTAWGYSDYARSWLRGAHMLLRNGTTTVADIEAMPDLLPELWDATPLRVFSFLEMTGIRARREWLVAGRGDRRRHRGHARPVTGTLGRHTLADIFVSGNDRHPCPAGARRNPAGNGGEN